MTELYLPDKSGKYKLPDIYLTYHHASSPPSLKKMGCLTPKMEKIDFLSSPAVNLLRIRDGNGSVGHGSWVKWVTIFGWVTWVVGHCHCQ